LDLVDEVVCGGIVRNAAIAKDFAPSFSSAAYASNGKEAVRFGLDG
jgi:hypothetical protein